MHKMKYLSSESGATIVITVIVLVALLGVSALAIDLGVLWVAASQAQNAADAAALAGADQLRIGGMNPTTAAQVATSAGANNTVLNTPVKLAASDVVVGAWNSSTHKMMAWSSTATTPAVQVTVRRTAGSPNGPVPTFFAKVLGIQYTQVTRSAVAGVSVTTDPRNPVNMMIVQDGSSSFQNIWATAISADTKLLTLVNGVSEKGDAAGMVTFNATLPTSYLQQAGLYNLYLPYPQINQGIKYTTDTSGRPVKTNSLGVTESNGQVTEMASGLSNFDPTNHSTLPTALTDTTELMTNGVAWGDTQPSAGLNYAISALTAQTPAVANTQMTIVFVSDGVPHSVEGQAETNLFTQEAVAAANQAASLGIRIDTVTLSGTDGADYQFEESLVRNGGYALRAADPTVLESDLIGLGTIEIGHATLLQ